MQKKGSRRCQKLNAFLALMFDKIPLFKTVKKIA